MRMRFRVGLIVLLLGMMLSGCGRPARKRVAPPPADPAPKGTGPQMPDPNFVVTTRLFADPGKSTRVQEKRTVTGKVEGILPQEVIYRDTVVEIGAHLPSKIKRVYEKARLGDKPLFYEGRTIFFTHKSGPVYEAVAEGEPALPEKEKAELADTVLSDVDQAIRTVKPLQENQSWQINPGFLARLSGLPFTKKAEATFRRGFVQDRIMMGAIEINAESMAPVMSARGELQIAVDGQSTLQKLHIKIAPKDGGNDASILITRERTDENERP